MPIRIFSARLTGNDPADQNSKDKLEAEVNGFLRLYPNTKIEWVQSSAVTAAVIEPKTKKSLGFELRHTTLTGIATF